MTSDGKGMNELSIIMNPSTMRYTVMASADRKEFIISAALNIASVTICEGILANHLQSYNLIFIPKSEIQDNLRVCLLLTYVKIYIGLASMFLD